MKEIGIEEDRAKQAKATKEMVAKYRNVFLGSAMGHEVLANILQSAGFLQPQVPGNSTDAVGNNFSIMILEHCGIVRENMSLGDMREIVDALAQILPKEDVHV